MPTALSSNDIWLWGSRRNASNFPLSSFDIAGYTFFWARCLGNKSAILFKRISLIWPDNRLMNKPILYTMICSQWFFWMQFLICFSWISQKEVIPVLCRQRKKDATEAASMLIVESLRLFDLPAFIPSSINSLYGRSNKSQSEGQYFRFVGIMS